MQSGSSEIKLKIINSLLDQLHGYYSQCAQKYTEEPSDHANYEKAYNEAKFYLDFIEANCAAWILTPEAAPAKSKYDNCSGYAKFYLFTECKPPHPSLSLHSSIQNDANAPTI